MITREGMVRAPNPMEHRWGHRIQLEVPVTLGVDGQALGRGVLRNASISGALIETSLELPVYTHLLVRLAGSNPAATAAPLHACVVRNEPCRLAVEWHDMACPQIVALLERVSGRAVTELRDDEVFTLKRQSC